MRWRWYASVATGRKGFGGHLSGGRLRGLSACPALGGRFQHPELLRSELQFAVEGLFDKRGSVGEADELIERDSRNNSPRAAKSSDQRDRFAVRLKRCRRRLLVQRMLADDDVHDRWWRSRDDPGSAGLKLVTAEEFHGQRRAVIGRRKGQRGSVCGRPRLCIDFR